ncbi:MAG: DUF2442 domain-containing protein [Defluviicoccus sp.]|nr:DUF2442 domain-containing protein [Defluviicoccus sp.]MDG4608749.1 DUF2442 domain-containing protein [Defluviicoccus sp.]
MPGTDTSVPELTDVFRFGLWLLLDDEESFVRFEQFPWFRRATVEQLSVIERPTSDHLYWPLLDVDLAVQSIRNPSEFPLVAKDAGQSSAPADAPAAARR